MGKGGGTCGNCPPLPTAIATWLGAVYHSHGSRRAHWRGGGRCAGEGHKKHKGQKRSSTFILARLRHTLAKLLAGCWQTRTHFSAGRRHTQTQPSAAHEHQGWPSPVISPSTPPRPTSGALPPYPMACLRYEEGGTGACDPRIQHETHPEPPPPCYTSFGGAGEIVLNVLSERPSMHS